MSANHSSSSTNLHLSNNLILVNQQSPGDICMMAYAIKALHEQYPNRYKTIVSTSCDEIFEGNPYVTPKNQYDTSFRMIKMQYPTINQSNSTPYAFVNAFVQNLSDQLNITLRPTTWEGAIWIREEEKCWYSAVHEILGYDPPYICINAGHKEDFTAKAWDFDRYQQIVDRFPDVTFVQIGCEHHIHPKLNGKNLINLIGKTDNRQLIRLIYNAFGVITPVSFPMHLAYAVPPHPRYQRKSRACIVIAGGREPNHWQAAANQQFLHTCGMLDCCDYGGCWKSRVVPLNDGDEEKDHSLCLYPKILPSGQAIAKCMDMITVDEVANVLKRYMDNLNYAKNDN